MNVPTLLTVLVLIGASCCRASPEGGLVSDSGGYKVAAYFGEPKYLYCSSVQWTRSGLPFVQEFILVNGQGWISYFEFTEIAKGESSEVLSRNLVAVTSEHHVVVGEPQVRGIVSALRELARPARLPRRVAYPHESVVISGTLINVAYEPEELLDWHRGLVAVRDAMRSRSDGQVVGKICVSYWGDKLFSVDMPSEELPEKTAEPGATDNPDDARR